MQLYHSLVHSYFIFGLLCGVKHSQFIFLHYIDCKTKPLELLLEVMGMQLLPLFIKSKKILPLPLLLRFSAAKFVYSHSRLRLSLQFHNYFTLSKCVHYHTTRFSSNNQIIIPLFKSQKNTKIDQIYWS